MDQPDRCRAQGYGEGAVFRRTAKLAELACEGEDQHAVENMDQQIRVFEKPRIAWPTDVVHGKRQQTQRPPERAGVTRKHETREIGCRADTAIEPKRLKITNVVEKKRACKPVFEKAEAQYGQRPKTKAED